MNILWVTSEAVPFAKTGGLADVSAALPSALADRGHEVSVVMPYYPQIMGKLGLEFGTRYELLGVPFGDKTEWAQVQVLKLKEHLTYYFIEFHRFYDRPNLYDWYGNEYSDNGQRFIFLCRAAMQAVLALKLKPDIIHSHDWHAALCSVYLNSSLYWNYDNFKNARSVLTIHNIGYQGVFHKSNLFWTGLGWEFFNFQCLEFYDQLNFLKAGVMTSKMVNTVSPTYAEEILSPGFGFNLDGPLRHCASQGRLRGILNGIDTHVWDPKTDKSLPANFSREDLSGKAVCKRAVQERFGLPQRDDVPLFTIISRLAHQKGLDVFASGLEEMLEKDDFQFVVVGSGDQYLQGHLNYLANKYPTKMGIYIGYAGEKLAHLVEAGGDFFIMPSRYEPCGLNQMYSMRYGNVPVVRSTGGLADTVINYDPYDHIDESTGFSFWDLYPESLNNTIRWAAKIYRNNRDDYWKLQENGMSRDFSWNRTAAEYEQLYEDAHK